MSWLKVLIGLAYFKIPLHFKNIKEEIIIRHFCTRRSQDQPAFAGLTLNRRAWCGYTHSSNCRKAFDTVRHYTLLQKAAELDLPHHVFNWLVDFFEGHSHCTVYAGDTSGTKKITASIIQGSSIGPASYIITSSDLAKSILIIVWSNMLMIPIWYYLPPESIPALQK